MVESKASKTVLPAMAVPMEILRRSIGGPRPVRMSVVHRASTTGPPSRGVAPGVEALDVRAFVDALRSETGRVKGRHHRV